jgi:hypothetical protein
MTAKGESDGKPETGWGNLGGKKDTQRRFEG